MNRFPQLSLATLLTTVAVLAVLSGPSLAQGVDTDLVMVDVTVEDAVFDAPDPGNVTATILNNGSNDASGVVHFRYNTSNRSLTDDGRSDQPFNTTEPLGPGETVDVTIDWRPSRDQIGRGEVLGVLTSTSDDTPDNNEATQPVFVERYDLNATVLDDGHRTLPGRTTGYRVLVENTGNAPLDPFAGVARNPPPGWTADAPAVPGTLDPGESVLAYALVTPPDNDRDDLPDGTKATATIEWSARENPNGNVTRQLPNTTVQRDPVEPYRYGADLTAASGVVPVNPQAPARTTVNVTNTGNVADVFSVEASVRGELASNLDVALARDLVVLPAGESIELPVTVRLSGDPPASRHANLTVEASSVNEFVEPDATSATSMDVRVASPDLALESPAWPTPVYQGDGTASLGVTVRNVGQGPVPATNVTAKAVRGGFPFAEDRTSVPALAPGESVNVTVGLPVANLSGAYEVELAVDPGGHVEEPVEHDNTARVDAFVRTAGLQVSSADGLEALPGQFVRYERPPHVFYVRNGGNAREAVTVEIESQNGWVGEEQSLVLQPGAREPVPFSFVVPERPGTQTDEIHVTAVLANRTSVAREATATTEIVDQDPPRLVDVDLPENVTATQPFPVRTEWTDAVGVANASVVLVSPSNSTTDVPLERTRPGVWRANATVFELGTYQVRFRATDASSAANTFEHANPLTLSATYEQDPTVTFTDPVGDRVTRAGVPIPVEVHDPAGIATVRYEAAGSSGELAAPFEVPTDGWSDGEHQVTVVAENRFGRTTVENATYTVDNTAPEITDVQVDPEDPDPGQPVTVTVRADGEPAAGRVEFRDASDATVAEANLTAEGEDRFTATVSLGEGTTTGLAVVEDRVGNQATQEFDLDVGGKPIPAPGGPIAAVLAALAATVAGGARRRRG